MLINSSPCRDLFDAAPVSFVEIDVKGRLVSINAAGLKLIGVTDPDEVRGRHFIEIVSPADKDRVQRLLNHALAGQAAAFEFATAGSDFPRCLSSCFIPCSDDKGAITSLVSITYDNSALIETSRELRYARDELQLILDNVPAYIFYKDTRNTIVRTNRSAAESLGLKPEDMAGQPSRLFYPEYAEQYYKDDKEVIDSGEPKLHIVEPLRVDKDQVRWIETSKIPITDAEGVVTGILVLATDITDRKHAEVVMEEARVAAERANAIKSTFLSAASHDLRQPLQTIGFLTGALSNKVHDHQARRYIDALESVVETMREMLATFLDVSRLDSQAFKPEVRAFRVGDLLDKIRVQFRPSAAEKGLALRVVPSRATVVSDPVLLEQIVRNFVDNAIRYTNSGKVLVGCRAQGRMLRIEVWDTGSGIPPDQYRNIFEDFTQLDNDARDRNKGLGLGLGIVQRMGCLLGHGIDVRSWLGRGSSFSVTVPRDYNAIAQSDVVDRHDLSETSAAGATILLIEDDPAVQEATRFLLEGCGYCVVVATSGADALRQLTAGSKHPDLIIADYRLPEGENGIQSIRLVRIEVGQQLPAILVSGDTAFPMQTNPEQIEFSYLQKPVESDKLLGLIERLIGTGRDTID